MDNRHNAEEVKEHLCDDNVLYDGGRKINRDGVRIWIETYSCAICGRKVDVKEEILD